MKLRATEKRLAPEVDQGFQDGSVIKNLPTNAGDEGSAPGTGKCPGVGKGNPLQCSCLGHPTDRRTWWATVHRVTKSQT